MMDNEKLNESGEKSVIKKKMVLADFDETLISCDSMVTILKKEKWYMDLSLIRAGVHIAFAKLFKGDVFSQRSKFKYILLEKFQKLPDNTVNKYIEYFTLRINDKVIDKIQSIEPDMVVVASASEKMLIEKVLDKFLKVDVIIANSIGEGQEFKTCYGEEKARRVCAEIKDYNQYDIYVFSDSMSDMPIFKLGVEKYLVRDKEAVLME